MTLTLFNIADMLIDSLDFKDVYAGNIDSNLDRCIGVYNSKNSGAHKICIGGKSCTKTLEKRISILIHWTDNPAACEQEANRVLDLITDIRNYKADSFVVHCLICNDPVPIGKDELGICEYVIEATLYYERND